MERSKQQVEYLIRADHPELDYQRTEEDSEGWMLVRYRPSDDVVAAISQAEQEVSNGERVQLLDEWVWVDRLGREHFGPNEVGHDRFGLNE